MEAVSFIFIFWIFLSLFVNLPETNTHHPLSIKDNKEGTEQRVHRTKPHGERMKKIIEVCMSDQRYIF